MGRGSGPKTSVLRGGTGVMTKAEADEELAKGMKPYQIKSKLRHRYKELYDSGKQQIAEFKNLEKIDAKHRYENPSKKCCPNGTRKTTGKTDWFVGT